MKDASEDEQEDDFIETKKGDSKAAESRAERQEKLRKMMEDEGTPRQIRICKSLTLPQTDERMEESAEEPPEVSQESEPIDAPTSQKDAFPEFTVVVSERRRRGRRKVVKKKTIKDEEGYLGS
jgi:DNA polymerase delta subunit 3